MTHQISSEAAARRDAHRKHGKFGNQPAAESGQIILSGYDDRVRDHPYGEGWVCDLHGMPLKGRPEDLCNICVTFTDQYDFGGCQAPATVLVSSNSEGRRLQSRPSCDLHAADILRPDQAAGFDITTEPYGPRHTDAYEQAKSRIIDHWGDFPRTDTMVRYALSTEDPYDAKRWAEGRLDDVSEDHITIAFVHDRAANESASEAFDPDTPLDSAEAAAARLDRVVEDAIRRRDALNRVAGQSRRVGPHTTVGQKHTNKWRSSADVARDVRSDLKAAYAEGLLPAGTTVSVTSDSYAGGQAIAVELRGLSDADTREPSRSWPDQIVPTPYANALTHMLDRIADAYNRQEIDSQTDYFNVSYWSRTSIETEHGRQYRERETAAKKARAAKDAS